MIRLQTPNSMINLAATHQHLGSWKLKHNILDVFLDKSWIWITSLPWCGFSWVPIISMKQTAATFFGTQTAGKLVTWNSHRGQCCWAKSEVLNTVILSTRRQFLASCFFWWTWCFSNLELDGVFRTFRVFCPEPGDNLKCCLRFMAIKSPLQKVPCSDMAFKVGGCDSWWRQKVGTDMLLSFFDM